MTSHSYAHVAGWCRLETLGSFLCLTPTRSVTQQILPGELNMNVGTISLAMPPLPQPPVTEEESKGGAEDGQEVAAEKEEEEQQGENAPARSRRASAVSRASAADGDREGSAVGPMVSSQPVPACVIDHVEVSQAVNRHVSLMVTLDGLYWLPQTFPFEYYGACP